MSDLLLFVCIVAVVSAVAWGFTGLVRAYAIRSGLLDVPTSRSSHVAPTPRGGGLAIVLASLAAVTVVSFSGGLTAAETGALFAGGLALAVLGWLDDRHSLSSSRRLIVHAAAAAAILWMLGGNPELTLGGEPLRLGTLGTLLAFLGIVWLTNLYNFMDGIDGLAGSQAMIVAFAAGILLWRNGETGLAVVSAAVGAASGGFLVWNWPPARIFMGDVGSGFLGVTFATLALLGERRGALPASLFVLLLGAFSVDATFTLLRRVARGERWDVPHRDHAYQRLVRGGWTHRSVTLAFAAVTALLALAIALVEVLGGSRLILLGGGLAALTILYCLADRVRPFASSRDPAQLTGTTGPFFPSGK